MNIITLKPFSTRDPNTGRTYKYAVGETVKGRKLAFVKPAHIDRGIFAEVGTEPGTASILRRRDGRREWHAANGTDKEMDLEYQVYAITAEVIGNDALREKTSGQTSIVNKLLTTIGKEFAGRITIETIDGSDDAEAKRVEGRPAHRDIIWAHDEKTKYEAIALLTLLAGRYVA
jgi:hypothetical protein